MTEETLQAHLENLLRTSSGPAKPSERLAKRRGTTNTPGYALAGSIERSSEREEAIELSKLGISREDFIIEDLPSGTTLYSPTDIVQGVREFYESKGFKYDQTSTSMEGYEETLKFGDLKRGGFVQLDLGPGFGRKPGAYELWVTADFHDRS